MPSAFALHSGDWAAAQSCNGRAPIARAGFYSHGWDYDGLNALYAMYNPGANGGLCANGGVYWVGTYFAVTVVYRNGVGCNPAVNYGQVIGFKDSTKVKDNGEVIASNPMTYFYCR